MENSSLQCKTPEILKSSPFTNPIVALGNEVVFIATISIIFLVKTENRKLLVGNKPQCSKERR